ncbi:hypothetical protein ACHAWC_006074 [Mediolabrus comicus]
MADDEEWERDMAAFAAAVDGGDDNDCKPSSNIPWMADDEDYNRAIAASLAEKRSGDDDDDCKPPSNKRPRNKKTYGDARDSLVMESMPSTPSPPNCLHLVLVSRGSEETAAEDNCQLQTEKMNFWANRIVRDRHGIPVKIHLQAQFQHVNRHNGGIQASDHFPEFISELKSIDFTQIDGDLVVMANETLRFCLEEDGLVTLEKRLKRDVNPKIRLETLKEMGQNKQQAARANQEKDRLDRATEKNTSHYDALHNLPIHQECVEISNSIEAKKNEINHILSESGVSGLPQWMRNVVQQRNTVGHGLQTNQAFLQDSSNFSGLSIDEMVDKWIKQVKLSGAPRGEFQTLMWMRESVNNDHVRGRKKIGENDLLRDQLEWNLAAMYAIDGINRTSIAIQQSLGKRDAVTLEMTREFEIIALPGPLENIIATSPNRHFQSKQYLKDLYYGLLRRGCINPLFSKYLGRVSKLSDPKPTPWDTAELSFRLESEKKREFKVSNDQKKKAITSIPVELNYGPFAHKSKEDIQTIVYVANQLSTKNRSDLLADRLRGLSMGEDDEDQCNVDENDVRKPPAKKKN